MESQTIECISHSQTRKKLLSFLFFCEIRYPRFAMYLFCLTEENRSTFVNVVWKAVRQYPRDFFLSCQ